MHGPSKNLVHGQRVHTECCAGSGKIQLVNYMSSKRCLAKIDFNGKHWCFFLIQIACDVSPDMVQTNSLKRIDMHP